MKKTVKFAIALVILVSTAHAQRNEGKNIAKINLSAFLFKGIGLQYERQTGKRTTVALGVSFIPTSTVAFKSQLENTINNSRVNVDQFKLGTFMVTPELKYYFGKNGAFHGFYIAPYARISSYHVEGPVTYSSSTNVDRVAVFSGNVSCYSGGLLLGSNFKLSNKLYLDWWIIGASIGSVSGHVSATSNLQDPDERAGLKRELDGTDIPLNDLTNEVRSDGASVTSSGTVLGLRGLGINLGIRF